MEYDIFLKNIEKLGDEIKQRIRCGKHSKRYIKVYMIQRINDFNEFIFCTSSFIKNLKKMIKKEYLILDMIREEKEISTILKVPLPKDIINHVLLPYLVYGYRKKYYKDYVLKSLLNYG